MHSKTKEKIVKRTNPTLALLACFAGGTLMASPAFADVNQDLRAEIAAQRARLEQLEQQLDALKAQQKQVADSTEATLSKAVVAGDMPGSYKIPGTDTSIKLGGYIRLVAAKDFNEFLGSKFQAGNISPNGAAARNQSGNMFMTSKLSRLTFESLTPNTAWGPLKTMLAVDAFGSEKKSDFQEGLQNNGFHMRIVHAYATLGPLLVGQTWSNFTDDPDSAETIDSSGPAGVPSERQSQVRLTVPAGSGAASFSLENPVGDAQLPGTASGSKFATGGLGDGVVNKMPDLTAKYEINHKLGHAQISGIVRRFNYNDGAGHSASTTGSGLILGGTLNLGQVAEGFGKDQLGGQVWTGNGIGKYIPDDFGQPTSFAVNNPGSAQVSATGQRIYGGTVFIKHYWNPQCPSNLALGYNRENFADFIVPAADQAKVVKTAHLNVFYSPYKSVDLAVEYMYGKKTFRESLGLSDASASRLDFGAKFKF